MHEDVRREEEIVSVRRVEAVKAPFL